MKIKINEENLIDYDITYPVKVRIVKEHYAAIARRTHKKRFAGKTKEEVRKIMSDVSKSRFK
jgi:hypothetical protein